MSNVQELKPYGIAEGMNHCLRELEYASLVQGMALSMDHRLIDLGRLGNVIATLSKVFEETETVRLAELNTRLASAMGRDPESSNAMNEMFGIGAK